MFGTEWGGKTNGCKRDYSFITKASPLVWNEHCIECGAPQCYSTCLQYRKRKDGRCRLFKNGVSKISKQGLIGYSSSITFEGWSKLETTYRQKQIPIYRIKQLDKFCYFVFSCCKPISSIFEKKKKIWKLCSYAWELRERLSNKLNNHSKKEPDAFLMDVDNPDEAINIVLEIRDTHKHTKYVNKLLLNKGNNKITISYDELRVDAKTQHYITIKPERDCTMVFNVLDFVTFANSYKEKIQRQMIKHESQKKIKCIAWDLDNTVWDGILIEGEVKLRNNIIETMKKMDEKGIINSVVSKNNKEEALAKIKEFGLDNLIVMPQINWNPKSVNISNLAKKMNIGIDTICFIDDSLFELAEVSNAHPEVLCVNIDSIDKLEKMECFDTIVTEDSKKRRLTYKMMEKEQEELESWDGDLNEFLKTCNIEVTISKPNDNEIERCYELLQRTNQLNSSGRRLSLEETISYIKSNNYACFVLKVKDKFGDYGTTGFSIFSTNDKTITDFVISCRIANKTIEQSFIQYLYNKYCKDNELLKINYKKTNKNGPLFRIITDLKMDKLFVNGEIETYSFNNEANKYNIVKIIPID